MAFHFPLTAVISFIPYLQYCHSTWISSNTHPIDLLSILGSNFFPTQFRLKISGLHTDELFNLLALYSGYFPSSLSLKRILRDTNDKHLKGFALTFISKICSFSLKLTCHQAVCSAQVPARIFFHNLSTGGLPSEWRDRTPLILTDSLGTLLSVCARVCVGEDCVTSTRSSQLYV